MQRKAIFVVVSHGRISLVNLVVCNLIGCAELGYPLDFTFKHLNEVFGPWICFIYSIF